MLTRMFSPPAAHRQAAIPGDRLHRLPLVSEARAGPCEPVSRRGGGGCLLLVPRVAESRLSLCLWEPGGLFSTPRQVLPIAKTDHQVIIWKNGAPFFT